MKISKHYPLHLLNTFGFDVYAERYAPFSCVEELSHLISMDEGPYLILGGGSNICFTRNPQGLVLHNQIKGIKILSENENNITILVGGGHNWHELVLYCIDQGWGGIENLSLIPGTVGAAPIQNIGAYGVELKDVFEYLTAYNLETQTIEKFDKQTCQFGYRDSFFKREGKGKYIILDVALCLSKKEHRLSLEYGAIRQTLEQLGKADNPDIADISKAVVHIRTSKLPDPAFIGNAGSFFKNPVIDLSLFRKIHEQFPHVPYFQLDQDHYKVPAGWLIEQCGWKGKRIGNVGCHKDQALVLVHYGEGSGKEIVQLCNEIKKSVSSKFGVSLQEEVNII